MTYEHLGVSLYWQHMTYCMFHRLTCEIDRNEQQLKG